jgi:(E)-4-hydroxy-3-methylbut-2-enyl-diphosphate synthase
MLNNLDHKTPFGQPRRSTIAVNIGGIMMGSEYPIRIQSMTNTLTSDIAGSVAQCERIIRAGADYVRFTVPSLADVNAVASIKKELVKKGHTTPIIADVHFNPDIAIKVADYVDKVRINPGNFTDMARFTELIEKCRNRGVAIRIGVNHGSLSERIMDQYGDTPEGMAESAMEFLRICKSHDFDQVVVSMKASNVRVMVLSTRLVVKKMRDEGMNFPLHLGVTEAGEGEDGRIKSAVGIGSLLADGLGDTIRVSLTEDPEAEIPVALMLIKHRSAFSSIAIPPFSDFPDPPLIFSRRISRITGNVGGNRPPVVIGVDVLEEKIELVEVTNAALNDQLIEAAEVNPNAVFVYRLSEAGIQAELRKLRWKLEEKKCQVPVIFKLDLEEKSAEDFLLKCAAGIGGAFIDGFGDGLWLINHGVLKPEFIHATALGILQACRVRMSKTEYISCPSCGRTHFDLMETLARIKAVTGHLKGLKIGIMGCIVNGPGEMADADYGYVGAGKGKITLYRSREIIKKGIPEKDAVNELIALIKESGDWVEPSL